MKKLLFLFIGLLTVHCLLAQQWGEKVSYDTDTKYDVYAKTYAYSDFLFLVTDLRQGSLYESIESFNIKNLTVYRPFDGNQYLTRRPVIFFVHGGGWIDGYSFWYQFVSQSLAAEKGWILVSADYRLTSDSVFVADEYCRDRAHCSDTVHRTKAAWYPDNINDVAEAFSWTIKSIDSLGGDTNNIFIFGHSAGAHLVSLLATHQQFDNLRSHIRGVVSLSGAYQLKTLNMYLFGSAIDQTFQGGHENNDAVLDEASPWTYILPNETLPPFQLLHCSMDLPSLPEQKILFTNQLDYYGYANENVFFNGFSHVTEMTALEDVNSEPTQRITEFIEAHLYPTGINENNSITDSALVFYPCSPNPAQHFINFHFSSQKAMDIHLTIYNSVGKELKCIINNKLQAGTYYYSLNIEDFASGTYISVLRSNKLYYTRKFIVK